MKQLVFFMASLAWIGLAACGDKEEPQKPVGTEAVMITVYVPEAGSVIPSGADTSVRLFLWDELSLHEYTVEIRDLTLDSTVFYREGHTHLAEEAFEWAWKNTSPPGHLLRLKVRATDHENGLSVKTVDFYSGQ